MKTRPSSLALGLLCSIGMGVALAQRGPDLLRQADATTSEPDVSPVLRIERGPAPPAPDELPQVRSIDGLGNNPNDPQMNATETPLARMMSSAYEDGAWQMAGDQRPNPREVSNAVAAQSEAIPNALGATDMFWQWGQFVDHDIDLTDGMDPPEPANIPIEGNSIAAGDLALRDAFFAPGEITVHGIAPVLRGLASQVCQELDGQVVDDVRNFLFGPPGAGGFDLASLNIQRGRDHGLPAYNDAREALGLPRVTGFDGISSNRQVQQRLASVYAGVDDVDLWVGGLAEDDVPGAMVGPVFFAIVASQFEALRDGDRFWYQIALPPEEIDRVERTRLADIIRRNTMIDRELNPDVFRVRGDDADGGADRPPRRQR